MIAKFKSKFFSIALATLFQLRRSTDRSEA